MDKEVTILPGRAANFVTSRIEAIQEELKKLRADLENDSQYSPKMTETLKSISILTSELLSLERLKKD